MAEIEKRTLVKFTAPWCASCRAFGSTLERVLQEFPDIEIVEQDISINPDPKIRMLPTIELNGRRAAGNMNAHALRDFIKSVPR